MLEKLTREAILDAIQDYRQRGRTAFLRHHNATRRGARSHFICHKDCEYDLKAIVYVALLPRSKGRSVGDSREVAKAVANLEFTVIHTRETSSPDSPIPASKSREGREIWRTQKKRERDRQLSAAAIKRNKEQNGGQNRCAACKLTDKDRSMFDVHHLRPMAAGDRVTNVNDLAVLCPNCHRWAHVKAANKLRPLSIDKIARARRSHR